MADCHLRDAGGEFEPRRPPQKERHALQRVFLFGFRSLVIPMLGGNEFRLRRDFVAQNARDAALAADHSIF